MAQGKAGARLWPSGGRCGAVGAAASGVSYAAYLLLLGAFLLFASVLTPWAVALALRISVE